ncbi:MAG TPA: cytochrome P450 [Myxococcota bacterium]|nr:cytochrome P450 [Myxococcota bacterium]
MTDAAALPELHFDERFFRDPHGTTAPLLREGARAARVPELGTVFLLRYADVMQALLDRRFGAIGVRYYEQQGWRDGPYIDWVRRTVVFLDPPDHDRLRALLSRAFTPRQVARVRPITEQLANQLMDGALEAREVDFYDAFAQRLPLQVICSMLAIPDIDHHAVGEWTAALSLATATPTADARAGADRAIAAFDEYASGLIAERRDRPGDDLLSELIAVEESGDRLAKDELVAMVIQMLYAGHETTRNLIGNGLFTLLQHPAQLARLRREPALLPGAVEEMLRFEPPILFVSRVLGADVEWAGVRVRKGDLVHLGLAAGNRDPAHFGHADDFEIGRTPIRNLSFGWGMHFCLGASIARMEGRVAFETLLARTSKIEWAGPSPAWAPATALRTLEAFPVRLTSR